MDEMFTYFEDLVGELPEIPPDSIVSRTLFDDEQFKAVLFGFAPGQELSEHTSALSAQLYFVRGEGRLVLGEEERKILPGTWVRMAPRLPHSVYAETQLVMLLLLLKR